MLKRIWRGLHWSEKYGDHPGTPWLIGFVLLGIVASGHLIGGVLMFVLFGPLYLWGAYERGDVAADRSQEKPETTKS